MRIGWEFHVSFREGTSLYSLSLQTLKQQWRCGTVLKKGVVIFIHFLSLKRQIWFKNNLAKTSIAHNFECCGGHCFPRKRPLASASPCCNFWDITTCRFGEIEAHSDFANGEWLPLDTFHIFSHWLRGDRGDYLFSSCFYTSKTHKCLTFIPVWVPNGSEKRVSIYHLL